VDLSIPSIRIPRNTNISNDSHTTVPKTDKLTGNVYECGLHVHNYMEKATK
jgi:hypothetical protein